MSEVTAETLLGELVDTYALASKVLLKHRLDFCCGGRQSLAEACSATGGDVDLVLQELRSCSSGPSERQWSKVPIEDLVQHILEVYHAPLPAILAHLEALATRVVEAHSAKGYKHLEELKNVVHSLSGELLEHMQKEELVLFPTILSTDHPPPRAPFRVMLMEHDRAGRLLDYIVTHTDNFQAPEEACPTWRSLYAGLKHLDHELRQHIHLENNILFPRAIMGAHDPQSR